MSQGIPKELGHNSGGKEGSTNERLESFYQRVERLEDEKAALAEDIKEVFGEAKSEGWDVKIMRQVLKERKKSKEERAEQMSLFDVYWVAP